MIDIDPECAAPCPRCGIEQEDLDGFGVLHCPACGYCQHPSATRVDGVWRCDLCGQTKLLPEVPA
jgi:ribosomal protein L37AE/L43A